MPVANLPAPSLFPLEGRAARATRLPPDWQPSADDMAFAELEGFTLDETERIVQQFTDYWQSASGARARKCSWAACWRVWLRREADYRARRGGVQGGLAAGMRSALQYGRMP